MLQEHGINPDRFLQKSGQHNHERSYRRTKSQSSAVKSPTFSPSTSIAPSTTSLITLPTFSPSQENSKVPYEFPPHSSANTNKNNNSNNASPSSGGPGETHHGFVTFLAVVLGLFILWRLYAYCKRKREERILHERSAQVDRVLGDMQMVPNEDLDNDLI